MLPPPRALAVRGATVVVAIITARLVATDLAALHAQARASGPLVPVVIARHDLALGTEIGTGDVGVRRVFRADRPAGALTRPSDATGRVVVVPLVASAIAFDANLAARHRTGLGGALPPGTRAVRVAVRDAVPAPPGSVVDVLVTFDASSVPADAEPTVAVVEGAVVLAFGTRGDRDVPVTLLVPADAAARLAYAATAGTLTLVLDPPESAATT